MERIRQFCENLPGTETPLRLLKGGREYFLPPGRILFFETSGEHVYAHTAADAFLTRSRLYELERRLPRWFVRASKSAIVNTRQIYAVTRNLSSPSLVQFAGTHKEIYISRSYFREVQRRLQERNLL